MAIAATLMAVGLAWMPYVDQHSADDAPVSWAAFVLFVVASGVQVARRWRPVAALLVTASATAVSVAVRFPYGPITFAFALAVYSVARHRTLVPAAGWSLVAWAAFLVHLFTSDVALDGISGVGPALAWLAIPFTLGVSRRLVVEARSRERAEADHRLVDAERLRLAQEVHDVVGHGLAAIQMQADIALHVRRTRPDQTTQADEALAAISKASSEALEELRATLAEIRPEAASAEESRGPTPGIAKLDALCERVRAAGVDIDLVVVGEQRLLPPAADLAAYRVLQESLTDVRQTLASPARGGHCRVRRRWHHRDRDQPRRRTGPVPRGVRDCWHATSRDPARRHPRRRSRTGPRHLPGPRPDPGTTRRLAPPLGARRRGFMISVLLADDQDLVRIGLRTLIESPQDELDVAGEASDGLAAVQSAARLRPDVVLMDIRMPGIDGLEATRRIVADRALGREPGDRADHVERDEYVFEALRLGAEGFC